MCGKTDVCGIMNNCHTATIVRNKKIFFRKIG